MDENAKKKGLRMIPYGLQLLGAKHGGKSTIATINWTTQASFAPPLVVIGVKTDSTAHELVKQSKKFTLSMLGTGQKDLAFAFFKHVDPANGKFGNYAYKDGNNGCPIITDAPAAVECDVVDFIEKGDHSIVIGVVTDAHLFRESDPLTLKECGVNYGG